MLALQASKVTNTKFRYQKYFGCVNHEEDFKLLFTIIVSILTYSAEMLGYQQSSAIKQVQTLFCKRLACIYVTNLFALSECGRYPLSVT